MDESFTREVSQQNSWDTFRSRDGFGFEELNNSSEFSLAGEIGLIGAWLRAIENSSDSAIDNASVIGCSLVLVTMMNPFQVAY
jgi:hypothetical protein